MLNWKKVILPTVLAASLIVPSVTYAATSGNIHASQLKKEWKNKIQKKRIKDRHEKQKEQRVARIKEAKQIMIEAEQYVPGLGTQQETIVKENLEIRKQIREVRQGQGKTVTPAKEEMKKEFESIKEKIQQGQMSKEEGKAYLREKKEAYRTQFKAEKEKFAENFKAEKEKKKAVKDSWKAFTEAVKAKNKEEIQKTFEVYSKNAKELNALLQQRLEKMKATSAS